MTTKAMPSKRRLILVGAAFGLTLLPAIVMLLVTWAGTGLAQGAATWASIPAIMGVAAAITGGRRYVVIVSMRHGLPRPAGHRGGYVPGLRCGAHDDPVYGAGRLSRVGLQKSGLLVPVMLAWALIDPPMWDGATTVDRLDTSYLLWMTLSFFVGGLMPALIVSLVVSKRKADPPHGPLAERSHDVHGDDHDIGGRVEVLPAR